MVTSSAELLWRMSVAADVERRETKRKAKSQGREWWASAASPSPFPSPSPRLWPTPKIQLARNHSGLQFLGGWLPNAFWGCGGRTLQQLLIIGPIIANEGSGGLGGTAGDDCSAGATGTAMGSQSTAGCLPNS